MRRTRSMPSPDGPTTVPRPPAARLYEVCTNLACSAALRAAVLLGIPEALGETPTPAEELAKRLGVDAGTLEQLLRALSCHDVFEEVGDGRFTHSDLSLLLCEGGPGSMRFLVLWATAPWTSLNVHEWDDGSTLADLRT